jgi:hypothetical protein
MTATMTTDTEIDERRVREAGELRRRAVQLRREAGRLDAVLARSYRRRASELEMQAWLVEVLAGVPDAELHHAA